MSNGPAPAGPTLAEEVPASKEEVRRFLLSKKWWFTIPIAEVRSSQVRYGRMRLDADYYEKAAMDSRKTLGTLSKETESLDSIAEVFTLPRFKRIYTRDPSHGYPYLRAEEVFAFRPYAEGSLARAHAPTARGHFAKEGWLLMSSSGTVGEIVYTTKMMERFFLTHDLARIVPKENATKPILPGYLWAYLSSPICQALIKPYGAVVRHIEPEHLADLPIPRLDSSAEERIHEMVKKAWELRDEANRLMDEAISTAEEMVRNRAAKARMT